MRKSAAIGEAGYEKIPFDLYRTPNWTTELLLSRVAIRGPIWEPAAGEGDMAAVLRAAGHKVFTSDIRDVAVDQPRLDFLAMRTASFSRTIEPFKCIVTNPPFSDDKANMFLRHAINLMKPLGGQVAMLLSHDFDTALSTRGDLFRHPAYFGKLVLGRRIRWIGLDRNKDGKSASPRQIHGWFLYDWAKDPKAPALAIYP